MRAMSEVNKYFDSIPDEMLAYLAKHNWEGLELLCYLLTLDIEVNKQELKKVWD
jgi:hypothetical protein